MAQKDILLWVGKEFYKTPNAFISEARKLGCSRRIPRLPEYEIGKTRVFLCHKSNKKAGKGILFGYFTIQAVELITKDGEKIDDKLLNKEGVKVISQTKALAELPRGCGYRKPGGMYLVSYLNHQDMEKLRKYVDKIDLLGGICVFPQPFLTWNYPHSKSYTYIDGDELLEQVWQRPRKIGCPYWINEE